MKPDIELNIDQLVLEGFSGNEALRIKEALIFKLNELMGQANFKVYEAQNFSIEKIMLPSLSIGQEVNPKKIAYSIANSLGQHFNDTLNSR